MYVPSVELAPREGETVYTVLRHVSRSGMTRWISLFIARDGDIVDITYFVSNIAEFPYDAKRNALKVYGAGMDMGYHVVYALSYKLFGDGYRLKHKWI